MELIIGLIAGALGGNAAGKAAPKLDMGVLLNSIAGIVGGGLGSTILGTLGASPELAGAVEGLDIRALVGQVASGGIGGGVLMAVVGLLKNAMAK